MTRTYSITPTFRSALARRVHAQMMRLATLTAAFETEKRRTRPSAIRLAKINRLLLITKARLAPTFSPTSLPRYQAA
jgi:hypothetical protein